MFSSFSELIRTPYNMQKLKVSSQNDSNYLPRKLKLTTVLSSRQIPALAALARYYASKCKLVLRLFGTAGQSDSHPSIPSS